MATIAIYDKNPLKIFSGTDWPVTLNLVCSIDGSGPVKIVQMVTRDWPKPMLGQGQIWSLRLLYGKKGKVWIFLILL